MGLGHSCAIFRDSDTKTRELLDALPVLEATELDNDGASGSAAGNKAGSEENNESEDDESEEEEAPKKKKRKRKADSSNQVVARPRLI